MSLHALHLGQIICFRVSLHMAVNMVTLPEPESETKVTTPRYDAFATVLSTKQ